MCCKRVSREFKEKRAKAYETVQPQRHERQLSGGVSGTLAMFRQQQSPNVVLPEARESAEQMCLPEDCEFREHVPRMILMFCRVSKRSSRTPQKMKHQSICGIGRYSQTTKKSCGETRAKLVSIRVANQFQGAFRNPSLPMCKQRSPS